MDLNENFRALFYPESVALIGASNQRDKWGYRILNNLLTGKFEGKIFPVNPKEKEICGLKTFSNIKNIPDSVDMAVIAVPVTMVPGVFEDCIEKGVKAAVLITAGFGEIGSEGKQLEEAITARAREGGMVFVGPNGNGMISTTSNLYAVMLSIFPEKGPIAMVTQSGNIGLSMLSRGVKNNVGFSKYVSSGNEAFLTSRDIIEFYGNDPETDIIITYIEGITNAKSLFDVCKRVSIKKPVLLFKSGRTKGGSRAAHSHTGSIAGSDEIFDGACRQAGVLRCENLDELFDLAAALQKQPLPLGPRVGIVTSGGGWGVLASDACEKKGLQVTPISEKSIKDLDKILPEWWSKGNPIDLVAGTHNRYEVFKGCIQVLFENDEVDSIILIGLGFILNQKSKDYILDETEKKLMDTEIQLADLILNSLDQYKKPIIPATDLNVHENPYENPLFKKLKDHGILTFADPDRAAAVLSAMYRRYQYLQGALPVF